MGCLVNRGQYSNLGNYMITYTQRKEKLKERRRLIIKTNNWKEKKKSKCDKDVRPISEEHV